jgi:uncharacterized membrane protein
MAQEISSRGLRLFGHLIHARSGNFSLALLSLILPCDIIGFWRCDPFWHRAATWALAGGLLAAVPTALTGLADFAVLPPAHPAEPDAERHLVLMLAVVALFGASLAVRCWGLRGLAALWASDALAAVGQGVLLFGAWLGGELVFRHGYGCGVSIEAELDRL